MIIEIDKLKDKNSLCEYIGKNTILSYSDCLNITKDKTLDESKELFKSYFYNESFMRNMSIYEFDRLIKKATL